jgi:hypothetical protein
MQRIQDSKHQPGSAQQPYPASEATKFCPIYEKAQDECRNPKEWVEKSSTPDKKQESAICEETARNCNDEEHDSRADH